MGCSASGHLVRQPGILIGELGHDPEADVVVPVRGRVVVPIRHPHVLRVVVPTAPAHYAVRVLRPLPVTRSAETPHYGLFR
jgi:hypothetical protein